MKMVVMQVGMLGVNCYIVVSDSQNAAVIDPGGEAEQVDFAKDSAYPWTY